MNGRRRFLVGAGSGIVATSFVRAPARAAQIQWRLGHDLAASHPIGVGANEFAAAVRRESNGRMEIQVFPDNLLGGDPAMVTQLRAGAIQMNLQASGPLSAIIPSAQVVFVGYAFKDRKSALAGMDGELGAIIRKDLDTKGLVMFQKSWEAGFRQMTTGVRPIRGAEDLSNLKLRVPVSNITIDMWKTLGASPVPIPASEIYTSLQTHVADGADGSYTNILSQKTYEVQKYLSVTNHQYSAYWMIVNGDAWKALPPDLQTIVRRASDAAGVRENRISGVQNVAAGDLLVRYGLARNNADIGSFRAKLSAYYARWKAELGPVAWSALEQYTGRLA